MVVVVVCLCAIVGRCSWNEKYGTIPFVLDRRTTRFCQTSQHQSARVYFCWKSTRLYDRPLVVVVVATPERTVLVGWFKIQNHNPKWPPTTNDERTIDGIYIYTWVSLSLSLLEYRQYCVWLWNSFVVGGGEVRASHSVGVAKRGEWSAGHNVPIRGHAVPKNSLGLKKRSSAAPRSRPRLALLLGAS